MPEFALSLLSVHAHPDDEASKGAATVRKYRDQGVHSVLVCCTGGEAGDILNPAMDRPEVRERLADVRREELERSAGIIGYDDLIMLGYRDSGMPGTPENADPAAFANAPLDEAVGRLVAIIREHRPQVILTYSDEQGGYPHPDHLRVHDISLAAFDAAGDPDAYPDLGVPFQPLKMYYTVWSRRRMLAIHESLLRLGLESPFDAKRLEQPSMDHRITTSIPVEGLDNIRRDALLAHATQIDPESPFWFGLPPDVSAEVNATEEYIRARSLVEAPVEEDDLFAGIRARVRP